MEPLLAGLQERLAVLRSRRAFQVETYVEAKILLLNAYMRQTGLSSVIVGVSGGIDSAVVLSMAHRASTYPGSPIKRVVGVCLPYLKVKEGTTNQSDATARGEATIRSIGAEMMVVDLTDTLKALKGAMDKEAKVDGNAWAAGQLVSYLRTPALYYATAQQTQAGFPSIVLGTTNRDEGAYIGYFGKAADAMNDLQLISDLHKSEVYSVARYLGNIPQKVLDAIPTGDIYDGRTDEQLIGVPYDFIELHALTLTLAQPCEASLSFQRPSEQVQWDKWYQRIEQLHRENKHKYLGGSPSLHFDVWPRAVPGGWKPQNPSESLFFEHHHVCPSSDHTSGNLSAAQPGPLIENDGPSASIASRFVNLQQLPPLVLKLVHDNTLELYRRQICGSNVVEPHDGIKRLPCKGFGQAAFQLASVLSRDECRKLLDFVNGNEWAPAGIDGMKLPQQGNSPIGSWRQSFYSLAFSNALWRRISPHIDAVRTFDKYSATDNDDQPLWHAIGVSPLFRAIRYEAGGYLVPHYDSAYTYSTSTKTLMSIVIYLTNTTQGGQTRFLIDKQRYLLRSEREFPDSPTKPTEREVMLRIDAQEGDTLIFDHRILHDSAELLNSNCKVILRADLVFERCGLVVDDELAQSRPLGLPEDTRNNATKFKLQNAHLEERLKQLSQSRLFKKHLTDPYYSTIMKVTGEWSDVLAAGYFDDESPAPHEVENWKPQWEVSPLNWYCTPISKIEKRLTGMSIGEDKWLAVILSTGSFSPIHNGHIDMMEQAKQAVEANGGFVLGGYISPSHDLYVGSKLGGEALDARHRLNLIELATMDSDWLMADGWEALELQYAVNFTDVIIHLEQYLSAHIPTHKPIQVVYVFGSDHASFGLTFIHRGRGVCLNRPGYEAKLKTTSNNGYFALNNNVIFWNPPTLAISSTEVRREGNRDMLPKLAAPTYHDLLTRLNREPSKITRESLHYSLRDEGAWAYLAIVRRYLNRHGISSTSSSIDQLSAQWDEAGTDGKDAIRGQKVDVATLHESLENRWQAFLAAISSAIVDAHSSARSPDACKDAKISVVNLGEEQTARFRAIVENAKNRGLRVLSLDPCLSGDTSGEFGDIVHSLRVSRMFALAMGPQNPILTESPGYPSVAAQLETLPKGDYILFDDDTYSGFTMKRVKEMVTEHSKEVSIVATETLHQPRNVGDEKKKTMEITDLRDFLLGAREAGLAVTLGDGARVRAPYCLPYVSPAARASIPISMELSFSINVWKANFDFFDALPVRIAAADLDPSAQLLLGDLGFPPSTTCAEIAHWHHHRLLELYNPFTTTQ